MNIGKLRHIVTLQKPIAAPDQWGKAEYNWQSVAAVHAQIQSSAGSETVVLGKRQAVITHIVTIRHFEGVTPHWRLCWQGRTLEVVEVKQDQTFKISMTLKCSEVIK